MIIATNSGDRNPENFLSLTSELEVLTGRKLLIIVFIPVSRDINIDISCTIGSLRQHLTGRGDRSEIDTHMSIFLMVRFSQSLVLPLLARL